MFKWNHTLWTFCSLYVKSYSYTTHNSEYRLSTFNVLFNVVPCMITCSSGAYDMILSVNYQMVEGHFTYGIDNFIKWSDIELPNESIGLSYTKVYKWHITILYLPSWSWSSPDQGSIHIHANNPHQSNDWGHSDKWWVLIMSVLGYLRSDF